MEARARISGFSLIEIVLAIGIISFALIGILGMFPVALNSAVDSQRETQAAFIAQRIFSDLGSQKPFIQKDGGSISDVTLVDLTRETTHEVDFNDAGQLLRSSSDVGQQQTLNTPVYRAVIDISPDTTLSALEEKLAVVQITIQVPADAPQRNARRYVFTTVLNADPGALTATP